MSTRWFHVPDRYSRSDMNAAYWLAMKMKYAGWGLQNVKYGDDSADSMVNYMDGKLGEMAFARWVQSASPMCILHSPFRESYALRHPLDDFVCYRTDGRAMHVEVRHKTRNVFPEPNYEHCTPPPLEGDKVYVFTERKRERTQRQGQTHAETFIAQFHGPRTVLGWADSALLREKGRLVRKGTQMLNNNGGVNFVTKRDEWNIAIEHLYELDTLLPGGREVPVLPRQIVDAIVVSLAFADTRRN